MAEAQTFIHIGSGETSVQNLTDGGTRLNAVFTLKAGATGATLNAILLDENKQPVYLDGWAVTAKVAKSATSPALAEAECQKAANQLFTERGKISFSFGEAANRLARGSYLLEFTATNEEGKALKFPTNSRQPFARLTVIDSLR